MTTLVIRNVSDTLHSRLKEEAKLHHRSMAREAVSILENGLRQSRAIPPVTPYRGAFTLTGEFMDEARREGRA